MKETPYLRTVSRESLNVEIQRWRVGITLTTCAVAAAASPFSDSSISPSAYVALPCELLAVFGAGEQVAPISRASGLLQQTVDRLGLV